MYHGIKVATMKPSKYVGNTLKLQTRCDVSTLEEEIWSNMGGADDGGLIEWIRDYWTDIIKMKRPYLVCKEQYRYLIARQFEWYTWGEGGGGIRPQLFKEGAFYPKTQSPRAPSSLL